MSKVNSKLWVRQLADLLERLIERQEALHAAIRGKLEAMRRSDVEAMLSAAKREREAVTAVQALDDQRRDLVSKRHLALTAEGGCATVMPPTAARSVTLRELTTRLAPDEREGLLKLAAKLRDKMLAVGESNRVVELVCREMLAHFKTLFAAMVRDDREPITYRAMGETRPASGARVLDAVG